MFIADLVLFTSVFVYDSFIVITRTKTQDLSQKTVDPSFIAVRPVKNGLNRLLYLKVPPVHFHQHRSHLLTELRPLLMLQRHFSSLSSQQTPLVYD